MTFVSSLKAHLRTAILRAGYRVDAVRYVPDALRDPTAVAALTFDDAVCRRMVEECRPLTFLQVGVYDGITKDPLYPYIADHGWTGTLVEPQPASCRHLEELHRDRPGIQVVQAALAAKRGMATLYTVEGEGLPDWAGGIASFSLETVLTHRTLIPNLDSLVVACEVKTVPFDDVLAGMHAGGDLDVLQIDTEGADAEILRLFPFERIQPHVVHWEVKHLSMADTNACLTRLAPFGYRFIRSGVEDMLAVLRP